MKKLSSDTHTHTHKPGRLRISTGGSSKSLRAERSEHGLRVQDIGSKPP